MAAFTTALLLGLAGVAGGVTGAALQAKKNKNAASSSTPPSLMGPPPAAPPTALAAQSSAMANAVGSAVRTRKRAAAGVINKPTAPAATGAQTGVKSVYRPAVPRSTQPTYSVLGGTS